MAKQNEPKKPWQKGVLYKLLYERLTFHRSRFGVLTVEKIGESIGYSHETVYKALRSGRMTPALAKAMVKGSRKKIKIEELVPFILA